MTGLLIDWLVKKYPNAKRMTLKRLVTEGRVLVNDRPAAKLKLPLKDEDVIRVIERREVKTAKPPKLQILHEDAEMLVVFKPAGLLTSTVPGEKRPTLAAMVREHLAEHDPRARSGVIHRLDRDAQGLLVFSKNDAAYRALKRQFFVHSVDRIYTAVVEGTPRKKKGRVESRLVEYPDGSMHPTSEPKKGERAVTEYELVRSDGKRSLIRVTLLTGRKHQIRAHMSGLGTPIVGDAVYGKSADGGRLMLIATELTLDHPRTGKRMTFRLPTPAWMEEAVETASSSAPPEKQEHEK